MDSPNDWLFLKQHANNFIAVVQTYFTIWAPYHSALREGAIAIVFPAGLAWIGLMMFRAPADKLKSAVGGAVLLALLGVLLSTSSSSSALYVGGAAGRPVANGTYWSYAIIGNFYKVFKDSIDSVYNATLAETNGGPAGSRTESFLIMMDDAGNRLASGIQGTPAHELVRDYTHMCNRALGSKITNEATLDAVQGVGLGNSLLLGVDEADYSAVKAAWEASKTAANNIANAATDQSGEVGLFDFTAMLIGDSFNILESAGSASSISEMRSKGITALNEIPENNNPFSGGKKYGYSIPTKDYYKKRLYGSTATSATTAEFTSPLDYQEGKYRQGGTDAASPSDPATTEKFYPKNCAEAYELANMALANFRQAIKDDPAYTGKPLLQSFASLTTTNVMNQRLQEEADTQSRANGGPGVEQDNLAQRAVDSAYQGFQNVSAAISDWMLRYKLPMVISTCGMLAAALLIAFPIFATMAVFMGHSIIITYLKLLSFAFLVILLNDMFMGMASDLLSSQTLAAGLKFNTGFGQNNGLLIAGATSKAIIFSSLTVIEVMVAKLLIWDDVKSMGSFNTANVGLDSAALGAKVVGAAALTVATLGKGGMLVGGAAAKGATTKAVASAAGKASLAVGQNALRTAGAVINAGTGRNQFSMSSSRINLTPPSPPKNNGTPSGGGVSGGGAGGSGNSGSPGKIGGGGASGASPLNPPSSGGGTPPPPHP